MDTNGKAKKGEKKAEKYTVKISDEKFRFQDQMAQSLSIRVTEQYFYMSDGTVRLIPSPMSENSYQRTLKSDIYNYNPSQMVK
jgi:hypothetical protein